jgi:hypothetical protein
MVAGRERCIELAKRCLICTTAEWHAACAAVADRSNHILCVSRVLQVAEQQGKWLAKVLNQAAGKLEREEPPPFVYKHLGSMASIGGWPAAPSSPLLLRLLAAGVSCNFL